MLQMISGMMAVVLLAATTTVAPEAGTGAVGSTPEAATETAPEITTDENAPTIDFDYTGDIDIYTGAPATSYDEGLNSTDTVVQLAGGGTYDRRTHYFVYDVPGQSLSVQSTVADDIITTDAVSLFPDEGLEVTLYRKSKRLTDVDLTDISAPGKYTLVAKGSDGDQQILSFQIVAKNTGAIKKYTVPAGFAITGAQLNGEILSVPDNRQVDLESEGEYTIRFRCIPTGVEYEIGLDIDHTPPAFSLQGIEDGVARGPVTLVDVAEDESVRATFGGSDINIASDEIFRSVGRYTVTVTDPAGNSRTEDFTIRMYLNYQGVIFFLLAVGIIAGTIAFMYISKKKMRIR